MKKSNSAHPPQNPLVYLFQKYWTYSKGNRRGVITFWILFLFSNSIEIFLIPFSIAGIFDTATNMAKDVLTHDKGLETLFMYLSLFIFAEFLFWVFHGPARILERTNAFLVRANYRSFLTRGVLGLPLQWHSGHHSGDTIDRIEKGTSALYQFSEGTFRLIETMLRLIGSLVMLTYLFPPAIVIAGVLIGLAVWIIQRFDKKIAVQYRELNRSENKIIEKTFDTISNITTIIILRAERLVFSAINDKIYKPLGLFRNNIVRNETKWFLVAMCAKVLTFSVLVLYFWSNGLHTTSITIGGVYLLIEYLNKVSKVMFDLTYMYGDIVLRKSKVNNSEELARDFRAEYFTNHLLPKEWQQITVENLDFSYGDDELHLKDIKLTLNKGERIAFIGATGSGKSTCLKIIRGLYPVRNAQLIVDGIEIQDGFDGISQAISLIPQNPEIFATSILHNITMGAECPNQDLLKYSRMACFCDVVTNLPNSYNSSVTEDGVNLSGGERQRLALARGFFGSSGKDIILLDEPTSSLDSRTERIVYENIFREFADKTIVSTLHRLHLLPLFDRIYLFDDGRIIASGTMDELLKNSVEFAKLYSNSITHEAY
jgi:ATP-binding cassette subfamily B protein